MVLYNVKNDIRLFRISSDIIPFGSSPLNTLDWENVFASELKEIGALAREGTMRLSMHPGQYTVLNALREEVVSNAIEDLSYHQRFLDSLGLDRTHKIILHIGGAYGNKEHALQRFKEQYRLLPRSIKNRLVIENDHSLFTIEEVLDIGRSENIPVVFDILHHRVNPSMTKKSDEEWIAECATTWSLEDGAQKIHYSQQAIDKAPGAHSSTIDVTTFLDDCKRLPLAQVDVMLEVKDKNLSAIKCNLCTQLPAKMQLLEAEWARYKYSVLEHDPHCYTEIRQLLKDKTQTPPPFLSFYSMVQQALEIEPSRGRVENAAQHVWGYFKNIATEQESTHFSRKLKRFSEGELSVTALKNYLKKLAQQYDQEYLLHSYYFDL